uniref:uncharacterized protein KIAA2012 n=1 Tax=Scatophagus argus TaxID=75038 RepID=UPI001ED800C2|nr:uncharacterized protein KIAA2012 [Scatophagus argus]
MKDLSLSLLSRGCGRFISSSTNTGRHNERLDVCFTPQDYYIWRSQDCLLQLSKRGLLLVEAESTLPKTYSTRRGPLLLYSQDLVNMETSCQSETTGRKKRIVRQYTQQMEQQLSTLKELTAAILSYSNNRFTSYRLGPSFIPPLRPAPAPDLHRPSPASIHTTQDQPSPELLVQLNRHWLSAERKTEQPQSQPEGNVLIQTDLGKDKEQGDRKRLRLDLFLQMPRTSRSPTPQTEPQPWAHYIAVTPEEEAQVYSDMSLERTESSQHTEINHNSMRGELDHSKTTSANGAPDDQGCSIHDTETTSDKGTYERTMSVNKHLRTGLLPPLTVAHSRSHGLCLENTDRPRWEGPSSDEHQVQHLPPIAERRAAVVPDSTIQTPTQRDSQPKAERVGFQSQENLNRLHQQQLFLPLLFPGKEEETNGKQRGGGGGVKTERQYFQKEIGRGGRGGGEGGGRTLSSQKGSMILLGPEEEPPPPAGLLGCVAGCKGPGKQSSLAFLHNRLLDVHDPCESSDPNRGVVRGVLPLELRDLQNGKSVGCLILGPDGEIIQLSLCENSQDPSQGDDGDTKEQALQVLSPEGEELPWVIVLQPQDNYTEGGVELNTGAPMGDIQHHQTKHKLLDLNRLTETCSPSHLTQPVAVTKKRTKSTDAVVKTWKTPKLDSINRMSPLREQVGKEESNTEAQDEEEELSSIAKTHHLSGSHQPGVKLQFKDDVSCSDQTINSNEATTEDSVDTTSSAKRKEAEESTVTQGKKRDMKTVISAESDEQKVRMRKRGKWQRQKTGNDVQSTRSQKKDERANTETAETQDLSALPPLKKKATGRKEARGHVKMNEDKEERGEVTRQREESAGTRRGRLKQQELADGSHEKEEVEINQEMEEEPHLISSKGPSATQTHSNKTETNAEEDTGTDHLSTYAGTHSSIRSMSSLRSTASASPVNHRSLRRSTASSREGAVPASTMGLQSSHGRISSCSTVMITEEQLMLNPVKPESSKPRKNKEEEEAAAVHLAQRAERRRQEVERKRREREEEEKKQREREQTEEGMKNELEEARRKRAEEFRLKKLAEEEERRKREEEEQERARREQAQRERERRRQEERRRQMERLQRMREEEEQRRKAELERLRLEEERRQEEEHQKLQEMDETERKEYLHRKEQEEEDRRNQEEERRRREEEAALWAAEEAGLLARQMALLQKQLAFKRGLMLEAGGLEKTQGISRPWIYSYFTLLQLLGLNPTKAETVTP